MHAPLSFSELICVRRRLSHTPRSFGCAICRKAPGFMNDTTLLLVDDEPQIRRVLQTNLCEANYVVIVAKNGQEGIDTVVREHPDLVLLDINLPDMSGFDACRLIRLAFAGPILILSVRNSVRDKIDALDAGADDYIVKPFAMAELLAHVRAALRRSSAEQPLPKIECCWEITRACS
jgi:DNA-binding response OmpR family regulator